MIDGTVKSFSHSPVFLREGSRKQGNEDMNQKFSVVALRRENNGTTCIKAEKY